MEVYVRNKGVLCMEARTSYTFTSQKIPVRKQPRKNSVEQKRLTSVSHCRVKFALYIFLCKLGLLVNLSLTLLIKFVCKYVSLCPLVWGGRENQMCIRIYMS